MAMWCVNRGPRSMIKDTQMGCQNLGTLQSWKGGLENFLSNAPGDGAVEDVAEVLTTTANGGEIIVRTMNATGIPKHGPSLGMYPSYLTFDPDHHERELSYL